MSNSVVHDKDVVPMSGDVNDHQFAGSGVCLIPDAAGYKFTGIDGLGIAQEGQEIVIANCGTFTVTLANDDAGSAVGNRILTANGADILLSPLGTPGGTTMVWCVYSQSFGLLGWWAQP